MKLSVIVPAFNEEKLLSRTLDHIQEARSVLPELHWESELIVCNNNSTDRTPEIAAEKGAKVVFEPINQIGRARNAGANAATGDWFLFIDADSLPSRELLAALIKEIERGLSIGVGCYVDMDEKVHWFWEFWVKGWNRLSGYMGWAAGSFVACDAQAFREVGGFNTRFYASEEVHLCNDLKKLGRKTKRTIRILKQPRLITSARKIHLYSKRELLRIMRLSFLQPRKFVRDPQRCHIWYDGRR